jgi:hypothetical protein
MIRGKRSGVSPHYLRQSVGTGVDNKVENWRKKEMENGWMNGKYLATGLPLLQYSIHQSSSLTNSPPSPKLSEFAN